MSWLAGWCCLGGAAGASLTFSSKILDDFFYEFDKGDRIGVVGGNGVGKTTFLRVLMGVQGLDSGEVVTGETVRCDAPGLIPQTQGGPMARARYGRSRWFCCHAMMPYHTASSRNEEGSGEGPRLSSRVPADWEAMGLSIARPPFSPPSMTSTDTSTDTTMAVTGMTVGEAIRLARNTELEDAYLVGRPFG